MAITIDTRAAIRELEQAGADAEIATKSHVDATVDKAAVHIILAQLLIAGVAVAFLKLTA